jgi:hypothetical protein
MIITIDTLMKPVRKKLQTYWAISLSVMWSRGRNNHAYFIHMSICRGVWFTTIGLRTDGLPGSITETLYISLGIWCLRKHERRWFRACGRYGTTKMMSYFEELSCLFSTQLDTWRACKRRFVQLKLYRNCPHLYK